MGTVVSFDHVAMTRLRAQLGAAEIARDDLIAFARGHTGAVSAIHQAVLAAIAAPDFDSLMQVVTRDWPAMLSIDCAALALVIGDQAFCIGNSNASRIDRRIVDRVIDRHVAVVLRTTRRGHPLFGQAAESIRAEALISFDCGRGLPRGLILLGQHERLDLGAGHGSNLLEFLGQSLAAIIARWLTAKND